MLKDKYKEKLYPHQQQAIQTILNNNGRALLAMGVGSGKTLTSISASEALIERGQANNILVLVPASLKDNFLDSLKKYTSGVNILHQTSGKDINAVHTGDRNSPTYTIVSYELFRENPNKYMVNNKGPIDSIIADEIQRAKTQDSVLAQALINSSPLVKNFIGLSGSPTSNTPAEIVPIMKAVLGREFKMSNPQEFEKKYIKEVVVPGADGKLKIEKRLTDLRGLRELFGDSVFYFGKEELASQYPQTVEVTEKIPMSERQKNLYEYVMGTLDSSIRSKIENNVPLDDRETKHVFEKIIKGRETALSTAGLMENEKIEQTLKDSPKLNKIVTDIEEHLKTTPDGQVIVYSNLVKGGVSPIARALEAKKIPYGVFAGEGKVESEVNRDEAVRLYREGKVKVLVMSPAGKEGLDLPDTTMVAIADPHFNPQITEQAKARGIRIGGLSHRNPEERKVLVKKYISTLPDTLLSKLKLAKKPKSIEEWVDTTAKRKEKSNIEFAQILDKLRKHQELKIKPIAAPEEIKTHKHYNFLSPPGLEFRTSQRKIRKDKDKKRGKYQKHNFWSKL